MRFSWIKKFLYAAIAATAATGATRTGEREMGWFDTMRREEISPRIEGFGAWEKGKEKHRRGVVVEGVR